VRVYVHLQLENGYTDLQQTLLAYFLKPGRDFRKVRTPKNFLGSKAGEDGSCSLETKHDRRMAQRTKLFVLARILQELR
jgi:hypothetical protein